MKGPWIGTRGRRISHLSACQSTRAQMNEPASGGGGWKRNRRPSAAAAATYGRPMAASRYPPPIDTWTLYLKELFKMKMT